MRYAAHKHLEIQLGQRQLLALKGQIEVIGRRNQVHPKRIESITGPLLRILQRQWAHYTLHGHGLCGMLGIGHLRLCFDGRELRRVIRWRCRRLRGSVGGKRIRGKG